MCLGATAPCTRFAERSGKGMGVSMRLRSPVVHFFALGIAVGAVSTSSLGVSRPTSRPPARQMSQPIVPAVRPTPAPVPREPVTFISIDRVRYQVTCKVQRLRSNTADVRPTAFVTVRLRRVDGRIITQFPAPQLTLSRDGIETVIALVRSENVAPSPEVVFSGTGDEGWPYESRLEGRLTVPQRRGISSVILRGVSHTTIEYGQPLG
jgi:hypothetical protein